MDGYLFNEEGACKDFDYFNQRQVQKRSTIEVKTESSFVDLLRSLNVRSKGLPRNFKIQNTLDFVQQVMAKDVTTDSGSYISNLRRIQKYMIPLVINEFSFLVMAARGTGKTSGYLIPLIHKLVELKEIELRGRDGPIVLIVTHTEKMLKHVRSLCSRYGRATGITTLFTTYEHSLEDQKTMKSGNVDLLCSTAKSVFEVISKFQISLQYVKFLVVDEFEYCTEKSEYEESLSRLADLLSKYAIFPTCIFSSVVLGKDWLFDVEFMEKLAGTNVARLVLPPISSNLLVSVLPCHSVMDHCKWITRLLIGEDIEQKRTVVLVDAPQRAHYLVLLLNYHSVSSTYITRDEDLLGLEKAIRFWRTNQCSVIVVDYDSIKELHYGFVNMCVLFELPEDGFHNISSLLVSLSANLCCDRRIYIMINEELDRGQANDVLKFLESLDQPVPEFLVDMIDISGES